MTGLDALGNIWFVLVGVLLAGYSILDGFDLGIGVLFPFLAKSESEKRELYQAIGPVWDGNEVWLITAGGALFAAFPEAYATVFSGFYLALMLVLFALIFRAASLEFRSHLGTGRMFWERAFFVGSLVPALLFGVALGNVLVGVPIGPGLEYAGNFFTLLRPLPLLFGLLGLAALALQGSVWAGLKASSALQDRARALALRLSLAVGALGLLSLAATAVYLPGALAKVPAWVFTALAGLCILGLRRKLKKKADKPALFLSSGIILALWGIAGSIHYPNLVRASDPGASLTIFNSSSGALTLKVMLIIALIGMPVVIGYTIFVYRVFKGRVRPGDEGY